MNDKVHDKMADVYREAEASFELFEDNVDEVADEERLLLSLNLADENAAEIENEMENIIADVST